MTTMKMLALMIVVATVALVTALALTAPS